MIRCFVVTLILAVIGTGAYFGWQSQHRTEASALYDEAQATVQDAIAAIKDR
ncbi:MAG: hypothetical protein WDN06_01315 [Asticcacaulis sp.]